MDGPNAEFMSLDRRQLITKILIGLREFEAGQGMQRGTYVFPLVTWFSFWLADMDRLQEIALAFQRSPSDAWSLYELDNSYKVLTTWLPNSGIAKRFPGSRRGSASAVPSTSNSAPNTPMKNHTIQLSEELPQTPTQSSPAGPSLQESSPSVQPTCKKRRMDNANLPSNINTVSDYSRDIFFNVKCLQRDKVCTLSRYSRPLEAAYICPFSLARDKHQAGEKYRKFQSILNCFWSKECIEKWVQSIGALAGTIANALALTPSFHQYWDRALFALQPLEIDNDKREMKLRFHWLKPAAPLADGSSLLLPVDVPEDFMVEPPILADRLKTGGRDYDMDLQETNLTLFNAQTQSIICSGDEIIITTPNPDELPLPDMELLHLQWILHRLAALCAAAGLYDDEFHEDDDFAAGAPCVTTPPDMSDEIEGTSHPLKHMEYLPISPVKSEGLTGFNNDM